MSTDNSPLLILDLDETLIYATESQLTSESDFRVGPYHVYERPGLQQFLEGVAPFYELAIWSSTSEDYVDAIAKHISRDSVVWRFVWSRNRCVQRRDAETFEAIYLKDLKKVRRLGYDLGRVLIVDDTPQKVLRNFGNAIYVREFTGDKKDNELGSLLNYLEGAVGCSDFRNVEKRGWRAGNDQ